MNRLFFIVALTAFFMMPMACSNNVNSDTQETTVSDSVKTSSALYVEDILQDADKYVGKEISLRGFITHTCKHSGRRCFVSGKDQKTSMRVEAKGNIGGFNRELIGSEVIIKGILKEDRITEEYLHEIETKFAKANKNDNGEHCDTETKNINSMRKWMKENNKDYYSIYYVEGQDYEVVQ